jgi:hypothetical protein
MTKKRLAARFQRIAIDLNYTRIEYGEPTKPGHAIIVVRLPITASAVATISAELFELSTVFAEHSDPPPVFSITPGKIVRKRVRKGPETGRSVTPERYTGRPRKG